MKRRIRAVGFSYIIASLSILCLHATTRQQEPHGTYDGHWWLSISSSERTGFLNGYFDCYTYDHKGPDHFSNSADTYKYSITQFYEKGQPFELNDEVTELLHQFRDPPGRIVIDKYAEHAKEPHGGNNGLYWRQISANSGPELQQLGFVEGYLACYVGLGRNGIGTFSKPATEYVKLITQWYGFNRDTDDIESEREPTAIAAVLIKFRDQSRPDGK